MKRIGIVVDNYKVDKFMEELKKEGFTDVGKAPFVNNTTTLKLFVKDYQAKKIKRICQQCELYFETQKRAN